MLEQHVEVTNRPCARPEGPEQLDERVLPCLLRIRPRGAHEGTDPPGRDAVLVEVLGIGAEPGAGIVFDHRLPLLLEHVPQPSHA